MAVLQPLTLELVPSNEGTGLVTKCPHPARWADQGGLPHWQWRTYTLAVGRRSCRWGVGG